MQGEEGRISFRVYRFNFFYGFGKKNYERWMINYEFNFVPLQKL